jgi:hypothetical protein
MTPFGISTNVHPQLMQGKKPSEGVMKLRLELLKRPSIPDWQLEVLAAHYLVPIQPLEE